MKKPVIFVPSPNVAEDHQTKNAELMLRAGAALRVADADLDGQTLARVIRDYLDYPERIREMEKRSRELGSMDGANRIVNFILEELLDR